YSLRAREHPTVSTPVQWDEVEQLLKKKDPGLLVFEAGKVLKRVEEMGDLFEPTVKLKQKLPKLASDVGASSSTSLRVGSARAASEARGISGAAGDGLEIAAQAGSKNKTANRTGKRAVSGKKARKI